MTAKTDTQLRCPDCGKQAWATIDWSEDGGSPHAEVREYRCPSGCAIDSETVREIIGAP